MSFRPVGYGFEKLRRRILNLLAGGEDKVHFACNSNRRRVVELESFRFALSSSLGEMHTGDSKCVCTLLALERRRELYAT